MLGNLKGSSKLLILDEAQNIKDIGKILKIIVDNFPDVHIIATGSSSFGLSDKLSEPLTGRSRVYLLYPFSFEEVQQKYNRIDLDARIVNLLRFGLYPEVFDQAEEEAIEELHNIASTYLYKDILQLDTIKRADLIHRLLKALALQLGNEISYNQKEIDFIEEYGGKLFAFEFKWQLKKDIKPPKDFLSAYPGSDFTVISNDNYLQFL